MNKEVKEKWLDALRSGEYQQGREYLLRKGEFCCLGVLCNIFANEGLGAWEERSFAVRGLSIFQLDDAYATLPESVQEWAGLPESPTVDIIDPELSDCAIVKQLWDLNDNAGKTFSEIADLIEEQL